VRQGNIAIDGQGLSSPQAQVDLLSRSITMNAQVWADRLNAITGANQIDHQSLVDTPQAGTGAAPQIALDASALGSMYVGAVRLIGTEKGLGFNIGGNLAASTGDIVVDNNGDVRILPTGRLQAQGNASVSGANIGNAGTVTTHGAVNLATPGALTNSGTLAAGTDLLAQADNIANHGTIGAGVDASANVTGPGTANIAARTALQSDGTILTGADANLSAPNLTLSNGSITAHGTANLSASGDISHQNAHLEGNAVQVQAGGTLDNRGGAIVAGASGGTLQAVNILNQGGTVTSAGTLAVNATQVVDNTAGTIAGTGATSVAAFSVTNRGGTLGSTQGGLTVQGALDNTAGKALATGDLKVSGGAITNDQGQMAGQNVSLDTGNHGLSNAAGSIQGGTGATTIAAGSVQNAGGTITSPGTLDVQTPGAIDSQGGVLAANGAATVAASRINNQGGTLGSAQASLVVTGPLDNTSGKALAATDLSVTGGAITNDHGQLAAGQNLSLDTAGQALVNTAGAIAAINLNVSSGALNNQGGVVQATGVLVADTHGQLYDNSQGGLTVANGALTLNTGALNNQGGTVSGQQAVTLTGTALDNTGGAVVAGGPLALTGDSLANAGGRVASNGDATLRIANTVDNTGGLTHAGGALDVQAGTVINRNTVGGTDMNPLGMEGGTVTVAANVIDNTQGALRADSALTTTAATLDNTQGQVTSGGTAQLNVGATINTQGLLSANQALGVTGTSLTGDGTVQSLGDVNLKLASDFHNTGTVTAGRNATLDTTGDVNNAGTLSAGQALDVHGRNIHNSGELVGQSSNHLRADQAVTNSSLIDGGAVRIDAGTTVTNVDRIYGDTVSIGAGQQILNDVKPATGNGGVIASRLGDVNLGAPDIVNREHALIYSSQDLNVGGALNANGRATGQANSLTNDSATIDVTGNANLNAGSILNQNSHFATTVTDTGTVVRLTYRLKGSTNDIDPSTAIIFDWQMGSTEYYHTGTDLGWLDRDGNERGATRWLVLPSAQYPFSAFDPSFDWSRRSDGSYGPAMPWGDWFRISVTGENVWLPKEQWSPVGLAYAQAIERDTVGNTVAVTDEAFFYQPNDVIWDKFGVARPSSSAPPYVSACTDASPSCLAAVQTYQAWRDANFAKYQALNDKIKAFNQDFNARSVSDFYTVSEQSRMRDETVASTDPARILVGGNANLNGAVVNDKSQILVGGTLTVPGPVDNRGYTGTRIETITGSQDWYYVNYGVNGADRRATPGTLPPVNLTLPLVLATGSTLDQQVVTGTGTTAGAKAGIGPISNAPTMTQVSLDAGGATAGPQLGANGSGSRLGGAVIRAVTPSLAVPRNALFTVNTQPGAHYLIATDPRFTDQRQWLSSDYMLTQLGQDPNNVLKRLGDGFYEARVVADAVMLGTGQRFTGDYTDNEAQYIGLMNAGVAFGQKYHLSVGTELSAEQMQALTSDIVWLVEKTVTLPNGSTQKVLVPQVYLMTRVGDIQGDGTLIAANNTVIQTTGDVKNTGTIASRNVTLIDAGNFRNERGTLAAGTMVLNASQDIDNLAGTINAGKLSASAGRDINLTTTTATGSNQIGEAAASHTVISGVSSVNVDSATLIAGRDLNAQAASLTATGDLGMGAGRNINLDTVTVGERRDSVADAQNRTSVARSADIGTQITGQNVTLVAGQDVNAKAAYVNADGALGVGAGRDLNVTAGQSSVAIRDEQATTSGGFLSKSSTHTIDAKSQTDAIGSTFSGDTVNMQAKRDMNVEGSGIVATHDLTMHADRNMNIVAVENTEASNTLREKSTSGMFSGGGAGVTFGQQQTNQTQKVQATTHTGSQVGSLEGNVNLSAGEAYTQTGSTVKAIQGDVDIAAKKVDINAVTDTYRMDQETHFKQSGLTIAVSNPVIAAAMTAGQMAQAQSQTSDPRMKALAGAATGLAAKNAYDAVGEDPQAAGGVNISITVGGSKSDSTQMQTSSTVAGSKVAAGGNVRIRAEGAGEDSNLNVVGSDIQAGNNLMFKADNQVNLLAAASTADQHSSSQSVSGGVGLAVSYGSNGAAFGVTANAAGSRGKADGNDVTWTNSHATAGNSLVIESGGDTNLKGAVASGKQVVGDIGGNLNIESLQDTSKYHSKDQSASGSVTVGYGFSGSASVSQQKMDSDFASVGEQAAIRAGSGGYQIDVKGNTDLKGAVIAGGTPDKNSLSTDTLTVSDIQNHAHYSASSIGIGGGYSSGGGGDKSGVGVNQSGEASTAGSGAVPGTELPTTGGSGQGSRSRRRWWPVPRATPAVPRKVASAAAASQSAMTPSSRR
jgi:filamentous hemagglutinin